jgi:hypothetical protein
MDKPTQNNLNTYIRLHNRGVLHASLLIGAVANTLTVENFHEVMAALPESAHCVIAGWVRRIPRDPNVVTLDPLPEDIRERLFKWLDSYEARGDSRK